MVGPVCKRDNGFRLASFVQFRPTETTELMAKVKVNGALLHLLMLLIVGVTVVVEASTSDSSPSSKNGIVPATNGNDLGCGATF